MTRPTTTGKAQDLITFTRSTTGTYLDSVVYGDELVTNNAFNDATGWYEPRNSSTISAVSNKLRSTADTGSTFGSATTLAGLTVGKQYKIQGTAFSNNSSATVRIRVAIPQDLGAGTYITIGETLGSVTFNANFIAIAETMYVGTIVTGHSGGDYVEFDSGLSVKEVIGGQGTQGTSLLRTSAIDEARIEYDVSGNCLGLLVEEARTNLIPYSEPDSRSVGVSTIGRWVFNKLDPLTEIVNVLGPDGADNSARECLLSAINYDLYAFSIPVVSGNKYTVSAYVKLGTATNLAIHVNNTTAWNSIPDGAKTFTSADGLNTETFTKISITFTAPSSNSVNVHIGGHSGTQLQPQQSPGTVVLYGVQLEAGSFMTSTIPTSGSTVTRAADVASLAVSEFGYNQDQGTVVVSGHYAGLGNSGTSGVFELNQAGAGNSGVELRLSGASGTIQGFDNNGFFVNGAGDVPVNSDFKIALGFVVGGTNAAASYNGSTTGAYASIDVNTVDSIEFFKHDVDLGRMLNGYIKSVQYYPLRLSNAQLQALTV